MLERIKYQLQLRRLRRGRTRTKKYYDGFIEEEKDREEKDALIGEASHFVREEEERIRELQTNFLHREADALMLSMPPWDDVESWGPGPSNVRRPLTVDGVYKLRERIRDERKEKGEITFRRVQMIAVIIGAITGLVGALIGLFSILPW